MYAIGTNPKNQMNLWLALGLIHDDKQRKWLNHNDEDRDLIGHG